MRDEFTEKLAEATARYIAAFPSKMPDMRSMGRKDYYALPDIMIRAVLRGSPITDADFIGVSRPEPELGRVL